MQIKQMKKTGAASQTRTQRDLILYFMGRQRMSAWQSMAAEEANGQRDENQTANHQTAAEEKFLQG
jgi:hypothetical protein